MNEDIRKNRERPDQAAPEDKKDLGAGSGEGVGSVLQRLAQLRERACLERSAENDSGDAAAQGGKPP